MASALGEASFVSFVAFLDGLAEGTRRLLTTAVHASTYALEHRAVDARPPRIAAAPTVLTPAMCAAARRRALAVLAPLAIPVGLAHAHAAGRIAGTVAVTSMHASELGAAARAH